MFGKLKFKILLKSLKIGLIWNSVFTFEKNNFAPLLEV